MDAKRFDVITLSDIDFKNTPEVGFDYLHEKFPINSEMSDEKLEESGPSELFKLCRISADWIFQGWENTTATLPDTIRYDLTSIAGEGNEACLLASREYAVGVIAVWTPRTLPERSPPDLLLRRRHRLHHKGTLVVDGLIAELRKGMIPSESADTENEPEQADVPDQADSPEQDDSPELQSDRYYPFFAAWSKQPLPDLLKNESDVQYLGRIFTGGSESDLPEYLSELILNENLSKRRYERLYIRWTDALAVYDPETDPNPEHAEEHYKQTLFRAVQIFETCIFVDRLLRSSSLRTEKLLGTITPVWPKPFAINKRLQLSAMIKRQYITSPPVQSVEADRMLTIAFASFGITPNLVDSVETELKLLESRYLWSKTQFMATIALFAYLADKLGVFALIGHFLLHQPSQ